MYVRGAILRVHTRALKKAEEIKNGRKAAAKLVASADNDSVTIRVEQILRDARMLSSLEMLEIFLTHLSERLAVLGHAGTGLDGLPTELGECVCTLIWAAPRIDVPELRSLAEQLRLKFGDELYRTSLANHNDWVNAALVEALSFEIPSEQLILDTIAGLSSPQMSPLPSSSLQQPHMSAAAQQPPSSNESPQSSHPSGIPPNSPISTDVDALTKRLEELKRGL